MAEEYDFAGYATRANMRCSDGRIIAKDAFKHQFTVKHIITEQSRREW